jgi:hypothetical protein
MQSRNHLLQANGISVSHFDFVGHTLKILNFISFAMTLTIATIDFVLLFLGYYGQDLMRPGALHLYFFMGLLSPVADLVPLIFEISPWVQNKVYWLVAVFIVLYLTEVVVKGFSIFFARKLRNHLMAVPGQSV